MNPLLYHWIYSSMKRIEGVYDGGNGVWACQHIHSFFCVPSKLHTYTWSDFIQSTAIMDQTIDTSHNFLLCLALKFLYH